MGIPFLTPEEYFLHEEPRPFVRSFEPAAFMKEQTTNANEIAYAKANPLDIVLFVGSPGSGKSSFYRRHLAPLGYARVNQDILKSVSMLFFLAPGVQSTVAVHGGHHYDLVGASQYHVTFWLSGAYCGMLVATADCLGRKRNVSRLHPRCWRSVRALSLVSNSSDYYISPAYLSPILLSHAQGLQA